MGRALTSFEWLKIEDEIDAFSITTVRDTKKPRKFYQFLFQGSSFLYDADDFNTVLEIWQILDEDGAINL